MKREVEEDNKYKFQKSLRFKERLEPSNFNSQSREKFYERISSETSNSNNNYSKPNPTNNKASLPKNLSDLLIKPYEIGMMGIPLKKEYNSYEENVEINNVLADSTYIKYGVNKEIQEKFSAKNILSSKAFWCSAGNHDLKEEVNFFIELKKSFFISSMWIYWAFAPGEFSLKYSNDKKTWIDLFGGYKLSVKGGDMNWWKSVISDAKKRWEYRSFDEKINFDEPFFAKFIQISMRIPVNQFFGIYQIEFYTRSKNIVMIKSRSPGTHLCLSTSNGLMTNYSPVWAIDCLQAISYGDNREVWILQSNGFITTFNDKKCLESPRKNKIDIIDCGKSSDFKDDRERWIIDYDGKIRSSKEKFTCLSMVDSSFGDIFSDNENLKVSASSSQSDGNHNAEQAIDKNTLFYWASNPSNTDVVYEIYFPKYSIFLKNLKIAWKFPAKKFKVLGLLPDGYWKTFFKSFKNRDTIVNMNFMNYDVVGIKIIMQESTTKIENNNIYGIEFLTLNTGARFLRREPCQNMIGDINKWEIIYSYNIDEVTGKDYKKAWASMHITRNKFNLVKDFYITIPEKLIKFKENSVKIKKKIADVDTKFTALENKLLKFEDILSKQAINHNTIGSNEFTPAYDCAHIIRSFPSKRSGFYFIKNECMAKPLKVFCDFDSYDKKGGLDYLVYTNGEVINSRIHGVKNLNDVRLMCNKIGLEPIEIKNIKMLEIIVNLLKKHNFDFGYSNIIPLGYDYSCDVANCSKIYRSFNEIKSGDLNDIFKVFEKKNKGSAISNIFEKTDPDSDQIVNMAGLGKNIQITYQKISASTIVGFICSTNKDGSKSAKSYINIDCDANIRGEKFSNLELFSHIKFVCPRDCSLDKTSVYGTDIYTDNSSICRAAIHSGAISDSEGGIIELTVEKGKKNYIGSSAHNVETLDYPQEWDRSFKVNKFKPYCPIDKMKDYASSLLNNSSSSFLSISETLDLENMNKFKRDDNVNNSNFIEMINIENNYLKNINTNDMINKYLNNNSNEDFNKNDKTEKFKIISEFLNFINKKNDINKLNNSSIIQNVNLSKSNNKNIDYSSNYQQILPSSFPAFKESSKFIKLQNSKNSNENFLLAKNYELKNKNKIKELNSNTLGKFTFEQNKFVNSGESEFSMTTEDALISINSINSKDFKAIELMKKFSNAFKSMVGQAASGVQILLTDNQIGLKILKKGIKVQDAKLRKLRKLIYEIDTKSQQILHRISHLARKLKGKIEKLNRRSDFVEDYNSKSIEEKYYVFNSLLGKGQIAKWDYYLYNLNGHFKTISQKGNFIDNRSGSHLIIKNKDFYDFEARFSVLINDDNTFGIAFRYLDSFNYYIFEISNQGKGFKRIRRFLHGIPSTIDIKYDGGYVKNTWYNIKIRAQNSQFRIYMTTDNSSNMEKRFDLQFQFNDNELIHGTLAFASFGISSLLIDNISIVHIKCTDFNENSNKIQIAESSNCARHLEKFTNDYSKRWKKIDPLESLYGPSDWKVLKNIDDRVNVLAQITNIHGLSMYEEPTIFLLNLEEKLCKKGKINIKFKSEDEGIVGVIFKYSPNGNYYILEVSGERESYVRIRKKINGKFSLIGIKQLLGFDKDIWTKLMLRIDGNKFNAYITKGDISNDFIKVFDNDLIDNDLENGKFGVSTYKNKVYFDDIYSSNFDDVELDIDEKLFIDREQLPSK